MKIVERFKVSVLLLMMASIALMTTSCSDDDLDAPLHEFTTNITVVYYNGVREVLDVKDVREYYDDLTVELSIVNDCVEITYPHISPEILDICGVIRVILNGVISSPI